MKILPLYLCIIIGLLVIGNRTLNDISQDINKILQHKATADAVNSLQEPSIPQEGLKVSSIECDKPNLKMILDIESEG